MATCRFRRQGNIYWFNWFMRTLKKISSWFKGIFLRQNQSLVTDSEYSYLIVTDVPDSIECKTIYIVGEYPWVLIFDCPCGCCEIIYLNLLEEENPFWTFLLEDNHISIFPSVWRTKGCKSHFFVNKCKIVWCNHLSLNS